VTDLARATQIMQAATQARILLFLSSEVVGHDSK
jgi:hypothetical protein